jgi:CDP-diacylglycerol--glycerol-3-phosphate 3-phosphatidyltransferase
MNLPNLVTLSRLLGLPIIVYLLQPGVTDNQRWWALGIFVTVSLTDWLDGYLARKLDQVTELGKFLDPLVDKLLVLITCLSLIELNLIPAWGVALILARELTIAGWRVNRTGSIPGANLWGKLKTISQIIAIAIILIPHPNAMVPGLIVFWVAVALTLISGLLYVIPNQNE